MCVCPCVMYVRASVRMYVCMHVGMFGCMRVRMYVCMRACMYVCMYPVCIDAVRFTLSCVT
jgi:hypothetical protein